MTLTAGSTLTVHTIDPERHQHQCCRQTRRKGAAVIFGDAHESRAPFGRAAINRSNVVMVD